MLRLKGGLWHWLTTICILATNSMTFWTEYRAKVEPMVFKALVDFSVFLCFLIPLTLSLVVSEVVATYVPQMGVAVTWMEFIHLSGTVTGFVLYVFYSLNDMINIMRSNTMRGAFLCLAW